MGRMSRINPSRLGTACLTGLIFCVSSAATYAQKPTKAPEGESVTLQWAIALGLMVIIGISAFLNPKRSHLN